MLEKLQNFNPHQPIVVLNDFFLDRIIKIQNLENLYAQIQEKSKLGGSIRGISQIDLKGGNATNVAYAASKLGLPVSLITIADKTCSYLLQEMFSEFDKSLLFLIDGKPGRTTSLEIIKDGKIVNIMLSDVGDNENFGPEKLGTKEIDALRTSSAVIVTNWASNKEGTELSKYAFLESKTALHLLDPADIETRTAEFKEALNELRNYLDSLCLNENECNILLKQYGFGLVSKGEETKKLVTQLAKRISIPVDLHTSWGSYWSNGEEVEFAKSFPMQPKFVTGAGDVWDAANLIGYLANLSPIERLVFANGSAALYIDNSVGMPPKIDQVISFVNSSNLV